MNLFGRDLDGIEIAALVGLLATLVLWAGALQRERSWAQWFRRWEADRKARRDAEIQAEGGEPPTDQPRRGPWG